MDWSWPGRPPYDNPVGVKPLGDYSQEVNGGRTRPVGPGHPAEGLGVNCPPLGPSGHWSSPGGVLDFSIHSNVRNRKSINFLWFTLLIDLDNLNGNGTLHAIMLETKSGLKQCAVVSL